MTAADNDELGGMLAREDALVLLKDFGLAGNRESDLDFFPDCINGDG